MNHVIAGFIYYTFYYMSKLPYQPYQTISKCTQPHSNASCAIAFNASLLSMRHCFLCLPMRHSQRRQCQVVSGNKSKSAAVQTQNWFQLVWRRFFFAPAVARCKIYTEKIRLKLFVACECVTFNHPFPCWLV